MSEGRKMKIPSWVEEYIKWKFGPHPNEIVGRYELDETGQPQSPRYFQEPAPPDTEIPKYLHLIKTESLDPIPIPSEPNDLCRYELRVEIHNYTYERSECMESGKHYEIRRVGVGASTGGATLVIVGGTVVDPVINWEIWEKVCGIQHKWQFRKFTFKKIRKCPPRYEDEEFETSEYEVRRFYVGEEGCTISERRIGAWKTPKEAEEELKELKSEGRCIPNL